MKSVVVITPTIGSPELKDCIESVASQDYENIDHLIIVDGQEYAEAVNKIVSAVSVPKSPIVLVLPYNTGRGGWYGGRVMASSSYIVNHDYVMYLDQDNMLETNHVSSLVRTIESGDYDWVYSLRKIYSKDGEYICEDDCESLGRWPIGADDRNGNLIDTSCYFFKNSFNRQTGHIWDHGWGGDRRYYNIVTTVLNHNNFRCSGESTLKYRLGGNEGSVKEEFFTALNEQVKNVYGDKPFPWRDKPKDKPIYKVGG